MFCYGRTVCFSCASQAGSAFVATSRIKVNQYNMMKATNHVNDQQKQCPASKNHFPICGCTSQTKLFFVQTIKKYNNHDIMTFAVRCMPSRRARQQNFQNFSVLLLSSLILCEFAGCEFAACGWTHQPATELLGVKCVEELLNLLGYFDSTKGKVGTFRQHGSAN